MDFDCETYVYVDLNIGIDTDIQIGWVAGFGYWLGTDTWGADNKTPVDDQYHNSQTFVFPGEDDPNCTIDDVDAYIPDGSVYVRCIGTVYVSVQSAWTTGSADAHMTSSPFLVNVSP